ncbi:TPA: YggU family protein [Candidatus Uhrbacteria bacterium]|nr:YggU family protein [Candidatus Uhrbacteria bacterium]HCU31610.1 YggU family protein [Candidatus Uhrbacteria bacterium]
MLLTIHATPNAKKTEITGWLDDNTVKIKIAAPPREGKANEELIRFLAEYYKKPKSTIKIVRGLGTKIKQVEV